MRSHFKACAAGRTGRKEITDETVLICPNTMKLLLLNWKGRSNSKTLLPMKSSLFLKQVLDVHLHIYKTTRVNTLHTVMWVTPPHE